MLALIILAVNVLIAKFHQTKDFQAVGGVISIDESGNAIRSVVIKEIQNQKQNYKTIINP